MMIMKRLYMKRALVLLTGILAVLCFHRFVSKEIDFVIYSSGFFQISDYAYHIILVKTFWFDGFGNIYNLSFQQKAITAYEQAIKIKPRFKNGHQKEH